MRLRNQVDNITHSKSFYTMGEKMRNIDDDLEGRPTAYDEREEKSAQEYDYLWGEGYIPTKEEKEIHDKFRGDVQRVRSLLRQESLQKGYNENDKENLRIIANEAITKRRQERDEDIAELFEGQEGSAQDHVEAFRKKLEESMNKKAE